LQIFYHFILEHFYSYTPTGMGKAKSAMEAARAKKSRLMTSQKEENEHLARMTDWTPEDIMRPASDKMPPMSREEKVR
jgi:DNA-directed RNA polymerase subunit F